MKSRLSLNSFSKRSTFLLGVSLLGVFAPVVSAQDALPSREEMWRLIQAQQAQIEALEETVALMQGSLQTTETRVRANETAVIETREQVAVTADVVAEVGAMTLAGSDKSDRRATTIGGYGELHLTLPDGGGSNAIDFHRWVLFVNHEFNDRARLVSELELEHSFAGDGAPGEVELEQAYVEFDLAPETTVKGGLFLVPVGLLNENHEPTTFYGVERNLVEKRIIPTTWWEAGVALNHRTESGFSYDLALSSGLDNAEGVIRSGRQKAAEAVAESAAVTARVQYSGIPGLKLGGSILHQDDISQSSRASVEATLVVLHGSLQKGSFGLKALFAQWFLDGEGIAASAEEQLGYYIEPSWRFKTAAGDIGVFGRFSHYEYQRSATAFRSDDLWELGLNYWPIENVVVKLDYQYTAESEELAGDHWYNLGLGYHF